MVPRARDARDFLEELAKQCAEAGKPLRWNTPLGLPVINRYHRPKVDRIHVPMRGRRKRVNFVTGNEEGIDKTKAANAAAANFVHSVDAAHLQFVSLAAAAEGVDMVAVHDCFGALAPRAARLNVIIREQLIRLHRRNLLAEVWVSARGDVGRHVDLPAPPPSGTFYAIEQIMEAEHAFK